MRACASSTNWNEQRPTPYVRLGLSSCVAQIRQGDSASAVPMSFFELLLRARGFDLPRASQEITALTALPREDLEPWSPGLREEIARYHFANNPLYRTKTGQTFPDLWERLPIMVKTDYQVGLDSVITPSLKSARLYRASTSGSSGIPLT